MDYALSNLSFDFGTKRASATIQASGPNFHYMNVSVPIDPPANVSAKALEDYIVAEIRKAVELATKFSYIASDNGTR